MFNDVHFGFTSLRRSGRYLLRVLRGFWPSLAISGLSGGLSPLQALLSGHPSSLAQGSRALRLGVDLRMRRIPKHQNTKFDKF
jgi:hypothetical protein